MTTATNEKRIQPVALGLVLLACVLTALLRFYPLAWNFAPVGALSLFAGARLRSWVAFALPLGLTVAIDALLSRRFGYPFPYPGAGFVYVGVLLYAVLGRLVTRTENPFLLGGATVGGSLQFFLVSNFGVWLTAGLYPPTPGGLLDCYVKGLGFLGPTLGGDLVFAAALFGAHAWLTRCFFGDERTPALALAEGKDHR